ncbi:hypothetical protein Rxyl_1325 [Rubrobacter xylanophilus DSM 9941]|uniref:Uncharacterized protein n=1 Tax=Rubrobacter xylanophilus (strain DSM 9941 / JCM 11954 / NBRC 16129 / PRD-1) TaxID=266117 RepID=Q1AWD9_RUBXD|nr:hypothetical protein [Rubrobacter xylanophilus]ABG04289.1 hypothetical protein Rxyl_1325 [Rubrobacter xylanophilus DSM 9941]
MADERGQESLEEWHARVPRVADALRRGTRASVVTWGGAELDGLICDRDQSGLLMDVRKPPEESPGYLFIPWGSIQQVRVEEVIQRRVKYLPP